MTTTSVIRKTEAVKSVGMGFTTLAKPVDPGSDSNIGSPPEGGGQDSTMLAAIIGGAIGGAVVIILVIVVIVVFSRRNKHDTGNLKLYMQLECDTL